MKLTKLYKVLDENQKEDLKRLAGINKTKINEIKGEYGEVSVSFGGKEDLWDWLKKEIENVKRIGKDIERMRERLKEIDKQIQDLKKKK